MMFGYLRPFSLFGRKNGGSGRSSCKKPRKITPIFSNTIG
jgi:hypothetical protein